MYALLFPLLLGQCGPGGCSIVPDWPQWQPMVVDRTDRQPAVFDVEVVPQGGQVWFDQAPLPLSAGKGRIRTPPLEPGRRYRYRVTARWGDVEREWTLDFLPGQTVRVVLRRDVPAPATSGSNAGTSGSPAASASPPASRKASSPPPGDASQPEGQLPVVEQDGVQNFGIDRAGLGGSAERITLDGRAITRSDAARILHAGSLADDSGKLRLTVIGNDVDRKRVLEDLKGPLADIADECLVQDYPPDHWAVARAGFYTAGGPTIYVQALDGTVLHRQDDYADGAEGLRQAFERIRRPDPDYRPDKDRDLRRPADGLLSRLIDVLARPFRVVLSWAPAAGVVFVLILLVMKGRLVYLLGLLASLVPGSPPQAKTAGSSKRQPAKRWPTRQSAAKSRARR
ncbi:MAG: hypothetical protein GYA33_06145 [Thermogutta sp.]|nr:hypothetical protein [Thermogutta sp.]